MPKAILQLKNITKYYPGVAALKDVSLTLAAGEVVGLVGENGAGKSTLMKVMGGVVSPSSGVIEIDGIGRTSFSVIDAIAAGIAFVHQELNLFDNLDVAANVFIGREPRYGGPLNLVDRRKMALLVQPLLDTLGVDFKSDTLVADLSIAQRQLLEIAKALSLNARIVIMDEPTSSLTLSETARLLDVIANLKASGVCVIFISHRLNELEDCADRVVVLRDGNTVGELKKSEISSSAMIQLMIGRDLKSIYTPPARPRGPAVLRVEKAQTAAHPGKQVSMGVHEGEILGLAGLVGSGRTELARALFGIDPLVSGTILLNESPVTVNSPDEAIAQGIFLVPEDRKRSGLHLGLSIAENICMANLPAHARHGLVDRKTVNATAETQRRAINIRTLDTDTHAAILSGGNQQKVVLAKWLSMKPKVLICDEPTRGIDVGAKAEIYRKLRELADSGIAVLMISSDMEEVIGVSDRIIVLHEGAVSGSLDRTQFSERNVLELAVGHGMN